jgi:hypothetical protein
MYTAVLMTQQERFFFRALLCLLMLTHSRLEAQSISAPKAPRSHTGTDFWLTVPPNYHTAQLDGDDNVSLFIAAERPTQGEIRFGDSAENASVLRFSIVNPAQAYTLIIPAKDIELRLNEQVSKRSVRIITDNPVSIYALNTAHQSADGTVVFPAHAAGTRFVVLSYPSDDGAGVVPPTPSQLGIVATSDSTRIRITPSAPTKVHGRTPHEITLQRGETYLLQADITASTAADLTGTVITSDKPIAVFSSHERATVPLSALSDAGTRSISRDYLLEQLLPVEFWGKKLLIPLLPSPQTSMSDATNHTVRVIASTDSTIIRIHGRIAATLRMGQFYETTLASVFTASTRERGLIIEGSEPIYAAVYASSNGSGSGIGDPFMMAISPQEQFIRTVRIVNVRSIQRISRTITEEAFREHYLTIVAPLSAVASVQVDNQRIGAATFQRFSDSSDYAFVNVRVSEGLHSVSADTTIGVLALGYGNATSYGYTAGQRLEMDNLAPRIVTQALCDGVRGVIFDSARTDSKLYRVAPVDSLQKNSTLTGLEHLVSPDSLVFTVRLLNPYQDGRATIQAMDSLGQRTIRRIDLPGFTIHADSTLQDAQLLTTTATLITGRSACFRLSLMNYGAFPHRIDSLGFVGKRLIANTALPIVLQPGERRVLDYCVRTFESGIFTDTLVLESGCAKRPILAVSVEAFADTQEPFVTEALGGCERSIEYLASDNRRFDSGVERIEILSALHCTIRSERRADGVMQIRVSLLNRRSDAAYRVAVRDSAGNVRMIERNIPGFNVRLTLGSEIISSTYPIVVSAATAQMLTCATVRIENLSAYPLQLDTLWLRGNIIFSLPPSELPFILAAHETKPLRICFAPNEVARFSDTLVLEKFCERESIPLIGIATEGAQEAMSRCNALIRLTPRRVVAFVASVFPQPASDVVVIDMKPTMAATTGEKDVFPEEQVLVSIVDMYGLIRHTSHHTVTPSSLALSLNITNVSDGQYIWQIRRERTAEMLSSGSLVIVR